MTLTDAGHSIFDGTTAALQSISDMTEEHLLKRSRSRLVISSIESVTEKWLAPRLADFTRAHPDFRFDLRVEPDPVDFAEHNIDLRLAYDPSHYPEHEIVTITQDLLRPVCSPAFLEANGSVKDRGMAGVSGEDLLHLSWGPNFGSNPSWQTWFAKANLPQPMATKGFLVHSSAVLLDLCREGLGVALGQKLMIEDDLAKGNLLALSDMTIPLGRAYCLAYPRAKQQKRYLMSLVKWLNRNHEVGGPAS